MAMIESENENIPVTIEEFQEAENYWVKKLGGELKEARLTDDFPTPHQYKPLTFQVTFHQEITGKLNTISRDNDLSLYVLLLTAFKILIFKYTGQTSIITASPVYNTGNRDYNKFVVLKDELHPGMTFKELLMAVKQTVVNGYEHEFYALKNLSQYRDITAALSLGRYVVLLEEIHQKEFVDDILENFECDIILSARKKGERLEAEITYNSARFKPETLQRLWDYYVRVLEQVLSHTAVELADIRLMTEAEQKQVLSRFNDTRGEYPGDRTLHQLFEEQAARTPDATAAVFPIDLDDIYQELAAAAHNPQMQQKLEQCCFKINPYHFRSQLEIPGNSAELTVIKTNSHHILVVNSTVLQLIDSLDGTHSMGTIFSKIQSIQKENHGKDLKFFIGTVSSDDMLEISFGAANKTEILTIENFADFASIIKRLYNAHVIRLVKMETNREKDASPYDFRLPEVLDPGQGESPDTGIPVNELLTRKKELTGARVLLLGDTTGMATTGLLYLASYLRRNGISAYCQFNDPARDRHTLRRRIREFLEMIKPLVVGISMKWFPHIARSLEICKIVKEISPHVKVVVGGNTASYYPDKILRYPYIDYVIRGDGELPLLALCKGDDYIPNCTYKKDGSIIETPITYVQDETNSSEIFLSHLDDILVSQHSSVFGVFYIHTQKGCGMNCFYCAGCKRIQETTFNRKKSYRREAKEVRKDILEAKKYTSTFLFEFEAPSPVLLDYIKDILDGIDLSAHFCKYVSAYVPSPQIIQLLNRSFKYVYWHLDFASLSQRHRRQLFSLGLVKPQPDDRDILAVFDECEKYDNCEIKIYTISGLSYLKQEDLTASETFLDKILDTYSCFADLDWGRLHAQPGAPLVDAVEAYDMTSYAATYEDYLQYSFKNLETDSYPSLVDLNYPYIYFKDDRLNSEISQHYMQLNSKVKQYKENKRKQLNLQESLTYQQLNHKSNQLARVLRRKGVRPDTLVGVMAETSMEMVIAILAVLKAGGAYLPLDPQTPENRLSTVLEDSGVRFLLTQFHVLERRSFKFWRMYSLKAARPYVTSPRPQILDLDSLPLPNRSLVDYEKYSRWVGMGIVKNGITLQATRGCPYQCLYCHKIWPKHHVVRSAENIFQEVQLLYNIGFRRFIIIDDIFNLDVKNSSRFFQMIVDNGLKVQFFFPSGVRADLLTREYVDLMVKAGTIQMALALETASPRLQKLVKKNLHIQKLSDIFDYINETYPHVILDLFTMHGFPTETEEEAMMTVNFAKSKKWIHFPDVNVVKIYKNTDLEAFALKNGISRQAIERSQDLAFYDLPDTLPFDKSFTKSCQADFFNEYVLSKERLLHVLPYQMKVFTESEMLERYRNYLGVDFRSFDHLLEFFKITREQLGMDQCLDESWPEVPRMNRRLKQNFPSQTPDEDALRILLLDLSQHFSQESDVLYNVYEPPLGLINLVSYLNRELGSRVNGKIAKSRVDFDSYDELNALLAEFNPHIIGLRTLTFYSDFFHRTAAVIRQSGIDAPVITGGPYATSNYEAILQDPNVDLVVIGEGEYTFCQLVEKILENQGRLPKEEVLKEIPGIAFIPQRQNRTAASREIIMLDMGNQRFNRESGDNLEPVSRSGDLAYTIFTSGTTGKPNGVAVPHRGIVNYTWWRLKTYGYTGNDVTLQPLSGSFDGFGSNFYSSLLSGGRQIFLPGSRRMDFDYINRLIQYYGVTNTSLVPGMYRMLLARAGAGSSALKSLRFVVLAGEESPASLIKESKEEAPHVLLINEYGPTETAVTAVAMMGMEESRADVIGQPIANVQVYILDPALEPVPVKVPGELCISGAGLARGYSNQPELTARKFIELEIKVNRSHMTHKSYKTGDRGRWLPDGNIQYLGRVDQQVKVRGYRIEPAEIERLLMEFSDIKAAVVTAAGQSGDKHLCAYIVPDSGAESDIPGLKKYLADKLPDYMVPSYFIPLEEIPLTTNGKIHREALPAPRVLDKDTFTAPADEVQERLAAVWAEILGISKDIIGIDSSFFELGGHSLNATIMISLIEKVFHVRIPLQEVFKSPTIRLLSRHVKGVAQTKYISIEPVEKKEYYPLSSAQKRLYITQQMELQTVNYNTPQLAEIEGKLDKNRLEEAFRKLIQRHESLRTSFITAGPDQEPAQQVHDHWEFGIQYHEQKAENRARLDEDTVNHFIRPFDLSHPPLIRVGLVKLDVHKHILMIDMHHIISDGVSYKVLVEDFMKLYQQERLPALQLQYKDFSQWCRQEKQQVKIRQQETYWMKQFKEDIPLLNMPTDYTRPLSANFDGGNYWFEIDRELKEELLEMMATTHTTVHILLMTVYYILLSKYTGQEDIVVGTPVAGRRHADLRNIIGLFVNMLAMRNQPGKNKTFKDFLEEVKENALQSYENQDFQFDELVRELGLKRESGRNPLFDAVFAMQNFDNLGLEEIHMDYFLETHQLKIQPYPYSFEKIKFDLIFIAFETDENITIQLRYASSLYKETTAEKIAKRYIEILNQVTANPHIQLKDIKMTHELIPADLSVIQEEQDDFAF